MANPPSEATFRVVQQKDLAYGVEVTIPGTLLTTVTGFATEAAEAWVVSYKEKMKAKPAKGRWMRG